MPVTQPIPVTKGKKTKIFAALLKDGDREQPHECTVTLGSAPAKGATTLTVTVSPAMPAGRAMYKGQYLLFEDADDKVYIAKLNADYTTGGSMTITPLAEGIPTASVAAFPVPFKLRTTADVSGSTDITDVNTYDHSVSGDASPGASTYEISTDGEYSHFDPGYNTCVEANKSNTEVYILRELAPPSPAFIKGKVTRGSVLITGREEPAPNDGNVSASVSFRFTSFFEDDPVATA